MPSTNSKPAPEHFRSKGHLSAQIQRDVAAIELAIHVLAIWPAYYQNGIAFYDNDSCDLIASNLVKRPDYPEPAKPATKS